MEWLENTVEVARSLRDDAEDWCAERSPWARGVLLVYLAYAGLRHLLDPFYASWFSGLTLGFHELGHLVLMPFGTTMHLLGGSLFQITVPLVAALYLLTWQRDFFGLSVGLAWEAFALFEMATYMADASREQLGLVGFSDHPIHDWSALFTRFRVLNHCDAIANLVRGVALLTWLAAMALGVWLLWRMFQAWRPRRSGA